MVTTDAAGVAAKVRRALTNIGYGATACPPTEKNIETYAWELMVAGMGRSYFDKRYEKAKEEALEVGVINSDGDAGSTSVVYDGDNVLITRVINRPSSRLDPKKLRIELIKAGVKAELIDKCFVAATKETKPATKYEAIAK